MIVSFSWEGSISTATKIWIGVSLGLVVIATAVFFGFFYQPKLTVLPTPGDASVTLDGQTITPGTPIRLSPGRYEVAVSAPHYLATKVTIKLGISQILSLPVTLRQIPSPTPLVGGVNYPILTTDQAAVLYLGKDGTQFFRVETALGADGAAKITAITPARFANVARVSWSPDRALAIIQKTDGTTNLFDFQRYDFLHQEERPLEDSLRSVVWHPTDPTIVGFRSTNTGERALVSEDIRTSSVDRLIDLRDQGLIDPKLAWSPDGRTIALVENKIILYDVATRALKTLAGTDGATDARWNPQSNALVFEGSGQLHPIAVGSATIGLTSPIRSPLAKAAWAPDGGSLLVATTTDRGQDQFVRYDLKSGEATAMSYTSDHPIAAENLLPKADASRLWFTSAGSLQSLVLAPEVLTIDQSN